MKKSILLIISSCLFISATIYGQGIDSLIKKAESGDAVAQCNLARKYFFDKSVKDNTVKAFYWYKKSAEQGYAKAQGMLAYMYNNGLGTPINFHKGFYWMKKSAEQGDANAQIILAYMYNNGLGTPINFYKGFYWMKKSAEQGIAYAQHKLALMYYNGEGTLKDLNKAFYWYKKSAEQGFAKAQYNLALVYYYGRGTYADKRRAAYWMRKAYKNGFEQAKEMWNKLELWKYTDTTEAKSTNNKVCSSIKSYGDINVCLPLVDGLTECYSNPRIRAIINHLYSSGKQTFMGVYINSIDYKKYKDLNDYRLFDEIIYVFAPKSYKNKPVNYYFLKELDSQTGNFIKLNWKELKPKIEKNDNYLFKVGKPILIEKYNIYNYWLSSVVLAQGTRLDCPVITVKVLNYIVIKHRLLVIIYNLKFNGETSIKEAKAKNNMFVHKFINANK